MDQKEKIERLKKLIEGSAAFSQEDKLKLVAGISSLTETRVDEAIRVFEEEIEDWKQIYKKNEENKAMLVDYIDKSQRELTRMSQTVVKTSEEGQQVDEETKAEELLKTI